MLSTVVSNIIEIILRNVELPFNIGNATLGVSVHDSSILWCTSSKQPFFISLKTILTEPKNCHGGHFKASAFSFDYTGLCNRILNYYKFESYPTFEGTVVI